jgi:pSer/pThr/pTyr-binding forkhead associated (FHA) protein
MAAVSLSGLEPSSLCSCRRDPSCEIVIDDEELSPQRAELRTLPDGRVRLRDLDSSNGTFVGARAARA